MQTVKMPTVYAKPTVYIREDDGAEMVEVDERQHSYVNRKALISAASEDYQTERDKEEEQAEKDEQAEKRARAKAKQLALVTP